MKLGLLFFIFQLYNRAISMLLHSKSSPLIEDAPKNQRPSNTSKRSSRQRDSNEYEYRKVANPLLSLGQENIVPAGLLREVGDLEYITPLLASRSLITSHECLLRNFGNFPSQCSIATTVL